MAIDGDRSLASGTRLAANYKGTRYICIVGHKEDGSPTFTLENKPDEHFNSPSKAGSEVMGGVACNGWRFWSLESELAEKKEKAPKAEKPAKEPKAAKPAKAEKPPKSKAKAIVTKVRNQKGVAEGQARYMCSACGEPFFAPAMTGKDEVPDTCPNGHFAFSNEAGEVQTADSVPDDEDEQVGPDDEELDELADLVHGENDPNVRAVKDPTPLHDSDLKYPEQLSDSVFENIEDRGEIEKAVND